MASTYGGWNLEYRGIENVRLRMRSRLNVCENLLPSLEAGAKAFGAIEAELFDSRDRGKWAAPTPNTQAYKAFRGVSALQMVSSGALKDSLTNPQVMAEGPKLLRIGTKIPYAKFQQKGFTQKWYVARSGSGLRLRRRKEPTAQAARPVIDLTLDDQHRIQLAAAVNLRARLAAV